MRCNIVLLCDIGISRIIYYQISSTLLAWFILKRKYLGSGGAHYKITSDREKKGFYIGNICYFTLSVKKIYKTFPIFVIFCFNVEKNLNKLDELDLSDEMRVVFFSPWRKNLPPGGGYDIHSSNEGNFELLSFFLLIVFFRFFRPSCGSNDSVLDLKKFMILFF